MYNILESIHTRQDIPIALNELALLGNGVEVGVAEGYFAKHILDTWKGEMLYLVDSWKHKDVPPERDDGWNFSDEKYATMLQECADRVKNYYDRCVICRGWSVDVANRFPDAFFDFIYIDASHFYNDVLADLHAWYPKLKANGIIAGHDYIDDSRTFGVKRAVDAFVKINNLNLFIVKDRPELHPSWLIHPILER